MRVRMLWSCWTLGRVVCRSRLAKVMSSLFVPTCTAYLIRVLVDADAGMALMSAPKRRALVMVIVSAATLARMSLSREQELYRLDYRDHCLSKPRLKSSTPHSYWRLLCSRLHKVLST